MAVLGNIQFILVENYAEFIPNQNLLKYWRCLKPLLLIASEKQISGYFSVKSNYVGLIMAEYYQLNLQ